MKLFILVLIFVQFNTLANNTSLPDLLYDNKQLNYFQELMMDDIYLDYNHVIKTDAKILVIDSGYDSKHEDSGLNIGYIKPHYHGTSVAGIIFSQIGNSKGYRGLVEPKQANFRRYTYNKCKKLPYDESDIKFTECKISIIESTIKNGSDIVNLSFLLSPWTYRKYYLSNSNSTLKDYQENWFPFHLKHMQLYRELFMKYPNKLFVIAVGNLGVPAIYQNGAIHLKYNKMSKSNTVYSNMANVITAGSYILNGNNRYRYHDYGIGIDFLALTKISGMTHKENYDSSYITDDSLSGTSYGAPQVTGVAAMIFDTCSKMQGNNITSIKMVMNNSGFDTITQDGKTYKILNAYKAVKKATEICNQ